MTWLASRWAAGMSAVTLPGAARPAERRGASALCGGSEAFCAAILEIHSRLDFRVAAAAGATCSRSTGSRKGDFDAAQTLINDCRKSGDLPLDICAEDGKRGSTTWRISTRPRPIARRELIVDRCAGCRADTRR